MNIYVVLKITTVLFEIALMVLKKKVKTKVYASFYEIP